MTPIIDGGGRTQSDAVMKDDFSQALEQGHSLP